MLSSLSKSLGCFADNLNRAEILYSVPFDFWPDRKCYIIVKTLFLIVFAVPIFAFLLVDSLVCFCIKLVGLLLSKLLIITIIGPIVVGFIFSILFLTVTKIFDILFLFFSVPDICLAPPAILEARKIYATRNYSYM